MSNVTKIRPDKPLTLEQIAREASDGLERDLLALGIDVNDPIDADDEDDDEPNGEDSSDE
jgi:hypothetical protein